MAAAKTPTAVTVRSAQVGFGDCFLMSFQYGDGAAAQRRHVLIDFGSTGRPQGAPSAETIAGDIKTLTGGKLDALVATHRHADHISGFGGTSGKIIAALEPDVIAQPWTEDPDAATDAKTATRPVGGNKGIVASLDRMHQVSAHTLVEIAGLRLTKTARRQLGFLGETNLKNLAAIRALQAMKGRHVYLRYGQASGLERVLPGVKVHVLGPPTLEQTDTIKKQRAKDAEEYWHFQALANAHAAGDGAPLFASRHRASTTVLPFETRWFLPRVEAIRGEQLLEIVRILDKAMNNTSLILLFEVGTLKLLFPGDAQIENWQYALDRAKKDASLRALLNDVLLYKVGHHGSLNATPKTLWKLFANKGAASKRRRLRSMLSTMPGKHGSPDRDTEVPRKKLVDELGDRSELTTTQGLKGKTRWNEVQLPVS